MCNAGRQLLLMERQRMLHPDAYATQPVLNSRLDMDDVTVRSVNQPSNVASAKALVHGCHEFLNESSESVASARAPQTPSEVLLQQGEDLLPQVVPLVAAPKSTNQPDDMLKPLISQILGIADSLGADFGKDLAALLPQRWDAACDALFCLQDAGLVDPLAPAVTEKLSSLRCLRFQHWAEPLHRAGIEAISVVIGPFISELFFAFDSAIESPPDLDRCAPLLVYVSQADAIASLLAAFELSGAERTNPSWGQHRWPRFGASLEMVLVEADGGELFLHFAHDGEFFVHALPFELVRERFASSCL
jgi:hypothetical protein